MKETANGLTISGDDESATDMKESTRSEDIALAAVTEAIPSNSDLKKRYLPDHKKPDAAPTFPEKVSHQKSTSFARMR